MAHISIQISDITIDLPWTVAHEMHALDRDFWDCVRDRAALLCILLWVLILALGVSQLSIGHPNRLSKQKQQENITEMSVILYCLQLILAHKHVSKYVKFRANLCMDNGELSYSCTLLHQFQGLCCITSESLC